MAPPAFRVRIPSRVASPGADAAAAALSAPVARAISHAVVRNPRAPTPARRRGPLARWSSALVALLSLLAWGEPLSLHACPMHDGPAVAAHDAHLCQCLGHGYCPADGGVTFAAAVTASDEMPERAATFPVLAAAGTRLALAWTAEDAGHHAHAHAARPNMKDPAARMPLPSVRRRAVILRDAALE